MIGTYLKSGGMHHQSAFAYPNGKLMTAEQIKTNQQQKLDSLDSFVKEQGKAKVLLASIVFCNLIKMSVWQTRHLWRREGHHGLSEIT